SLSLLTRRMRNEVPPWMSRPSWIFLSGGQMVEKLNATSKIISTVASMRLRGPRSVAKYQPNRMSRPRPAKKVKTGLIGSTFFQRCGHGRLLDFEFHVIRHFYEDGGFLHVGDEAVNAAVGDHAVTGFEIGNQRLLFLLPTHLRAQQDEIHDDEDENE